ncbi:MAG: tetratricopeptide repeat protein [Bacteroidota bacterium]|jgi:tetratricopeptide (TPR) repeat protein
MNKKKAKHLPKSEKKIERTPIIQKSLLFILGFFAIAVYLNTLSNGYTLDDFSVQKENNIVNQGSKGIPLIWKSSYRFGYLNVQDGLYRPLTLTVFALQWEFFPDKPWFGHFINLLLFVLTVLFGFVFLRKHFPDWPEWIAFWGMLLFAVHPIHTEVTGSIKSLDELMSFLFGLLATDGVLTYAKENRIAALVRACVFFFLALLSKESAVLFLGMIPLFLWYQNDLPLTRRGFGAILPMGALMIFLLMRRQILGSSVGLENVSVIDNLLMATGNTSEKFATVCVILGMYLKLLILPYPLLYNYSYNQIPIVGFTDPKAILCLLIYATLIAVSVWGILKRKRWALFSGIYLLGLVLYSNLVITIGAAMGERFIYFSSFGFCLALPALLGAGSKGKGTAMTWLNDPEKKISLYVLSSIVLVFSILTIKRNPDWKDNLTLYRKDLPKSLQSARSNYYLGNELIKLVGDTMKDAEKRKTWIEEAIGYLRHAEEIIPDYPDALTQMGVGYYRLGNYKEAEKCYKQALKTQANDAISINNLAAIYFMSGRYNEAIAMYEKASTLNPRFTDAIVNMGSCYGMLGKYPESINMFERALQIDPSNAKALFYMSKSYAFIGKKEKAEELLKQAQSIDPSLK